MEPSNALDARADERRRLAHELQNGPMQALAALAVQARVAGRSDDVTALRQSLDRLREGIAQVLADLRRLAREPRPAVDQEAGPPPPG